MNRSRVMHLVLMKGFAGSGKSTLARALSSRLGWPLIDKDDVKDLLDGHVEDSGRHAYDVMFNIARRQLLQGLSVICDSPLTFPGLYTQARNIAAETGAQLKILECSCSDEEEWQRRIDGRKVLGLPAHHQTDWASFQATLARTAEQTNYPVADPLLRIDTVQPLDKVVEEVILWLQNVKGE